MTMRTMLTARLARPAVRQRGVGLIEMLGALMIAAIMMIGLMGMVDRSLDDMKGQQAAAYQMQVTTAARKYIETNAKLLSQAGTPTLQAVTLQQLKDAKFLSGGFANLNAYGQGVCVLIRKPDPSGFPDRLDALVVGTGGDKIGDKDLPAVAMQAGPGSGYIATTAPTTALGASWKIDTVTNGFVGATCDGTVALKGDATDGGHLVSSLFYDGGGQLTADFLYRGAVGGHPELNQMSTPLLLAGAALVTSGDTCDDSLYPTTGGPAVALGIDATTHALLTCLKGGTWSGGSSWKEPVADYPTLVATSGSAGDVRMIAGTRAAYTFTSSGWIPVAVDQNGNFDVNGMSSATTLVARSDVHSLGTIHADGHIATEQDLHVKQTAYLEGNAEITGTTAMAQNVTVGTTAANANVTVNGDITSTGTVSGDGVMSQRWMSTPAVTVGITMLWHSGCNYPEYDAKAGKDVIQFPYGTIVTETDTRRPLICGPDKIFLYADGS